MILRFKHGVFYERWMVREAWDEDGQGKVIKSWSWIYDESASWFQRPGGAYRNERSISDLQKIRGGGGQSVDLCTFSYRRQNRADTWRIFAKLQLWREQPWRTRIRHDTKRRWTVLYELNNWMLSSLVKYGDTMAEMLAKERWSFDILSAKKQSCQRVKSAWWSQCQI